MARLTRKTNDLFAGSAVSSELAQFGSTVGNSPAPPTFSTDPAVLQANAAWPQGWQNAIFSGDKAPVLQEMNSVCYVLSYMLSYVFQEGIPEWDSGTTYYTNSIVKANGTQIFASLQDNNTNNAPPVSSSNAFWAWQNPPVPAVPAVGNGLLSKLTQVPNFGAPNTKVDVAADLVSVQGVVLTAFAKTVDITASGANGLDTGSPANNNWYAVHAITNNDGSLVASLFSLSPTAPTLPAGYTKFRRIGWVRRNNSGSFVQAVRSGQQMWVDDATAQKVSNASGTTSFASLVPPTTSIFTIMAKFIGNGNNLPDPFFGPINGISFTPTGGGAGAEVLIGQQTSGGLATNMAGQLTVRCNASQQVDVNAAAGPINNVIVLGYNDPV